MTPTISSALFALGQAARKNMPADLLEVHMETIVNEVQLMQKKAGMRDEIAQIAESIKGRSITDMSGIFNKQGVTTVMVNMEEQIMKVADYHRREADRDLHYAVAMGMGGFIELAKLKQEMSLKHMEWADQIEKICREKYT